MADLTTQLLVQARTGDKKARDTLVEDNLGLVHYIVKRFLNRGYEAEDLFQIGCIGLMKAIENEKRLIQWRFYEEKTQTEIAKLLNVNQVQICRMEKDCKENA